MMDIFDFSPAHPRFLAIVGRGGDIDADVGARVAAIVADIRKRGGDALLEYANRFDAPDAPAASVEALRVSQQEMDAAKNAVGADFLDAVAHAAENIRQFHLPQARKGYSLEKDGVFLAKRVLPISRVGVYCPAGAAPLFSSMLMNVIPAQIAGVREIAVAVPPRKDGTVEPHMLATAAFLGITEMYRMGGAHAVAALAYGAGAVARVDKIVGPGNAYVASAKRLVFGAVGIDSIAGPSEIVVVADKTGNAAFIAADLLSQVEHGSGFESAVLLTDSRELADAVGREAERMLAGLERADTIRRSLAKYGAIFICRSIEEAVDAANVIAPEHLELQTASPRETLRGVLNAGAVFLGRWSSEPVGDYYAGTNHVLPTNGAARFSSSLGVADFQKDMSVVEYGEAALRSAGAEIMLMARTEGLTAHENAVGVRCREK